MIRLSAELTLEEMLADPIVQRVMRSDGVGADEVRAVVAEARRRWRAAAGQSWPQAAE